MAGTSIRSALSPYNFHSFRSSQRFDQLKLILGIYPWVFAQELDGHSKAIDIKASIPSKIFESYFKFGFVRSPWDWQVSLYTYMLKLETHHQHHFIKSLGSFDKYIEWRVNEDFHCQKDFFYDEEKCLVDEIGKYESLDADFQRISEKLNINVSLPKLNISKSSTDYLNHYSQKSIDIVNEAFKQDIELFGYQKPKLSG